jgi:hypothetical protein
MAGTNPADEGLTGPTKTTNHINGSRSDVSFGSNLAGIVPVTKIPALDTIDKYAAEGSADDSIGQSPWQRIGAGDVSGDLSTGLIEGYARFVCAFTGLEDVAFAISCQSSTGSSQALICASVAVTEQKQEVQSIRQCAVRELGFSYYNRNEVQFAIDLVLAGCPENRDTDLTTVAESNVSMHQSVETQQLTYMAVSLSVRSDLQWRTPDQFYISQTTDPGFSSEPAAQDDCIPYEAVH